MRERINSLKSSLEQLVDKYNTVRELGSAQREQDVSSQQVLEGDFPWTFRGIDVGSVAAGEPWPLAACKQLIAVGCAHPGHVS